MTLGVAEAAFGRIDGIFEDNVQLTITVINMNPRMIRAVRFMRLLILVKHGRVKHIV